MPDHAIHQFGSTEIFSLKRAPPYFQRHALGEVSFGHRADDAPHFLCGQRKIVHENIDGFDAFRPAADGIAKDKAFAQFSFLAHRLAESKEVGIGTFQACRYLIDRIRHLAFQAGPIQRQTRREISFLHSPQGGEQLPLEIATAQIGFWLGFRPRF